MILQQQVVKLAWGEYLIFGGGNPVAELDAPQEEATVLWIHTAGISTGQAHRRCELPERPGCVRIKDEEKTRHVEVQVFGRQGPL